MKLIANAKINFTLDIKGKREDGYHLIDSVMQSVSLADTVTLEKADEITVTCSDSEIMGEDNIAFKAAKEFFDFSKISGGADIYIEKHIPKAAGLGGGSADAAAVIVGLNSLYEAGLKLDALCKIGLKVGADVPFCIMGGTVRATGIGEILEELPAFPERHLVIVKNGRKLSTKAMYEKIDSIEENFDHTEKFVKELSLCNCNKALQYTGNSFEAVCKIDNMKQIAAEFNPVTVGLSGSGPSVFFVLENDEIASALAKKLFHLGFEPHIAKTQSYGIKKTE
ncbi:MAG: 4-(cytidine 5'-diphospho)-2-C-methyl-D-erythritol kinase [Clostridia bacterium]|nr:4-(cytidine 5'-diphospho)-2-C-methyl-D-erythritol kinase [Clostridia bacterium]